MVDASSLVIPKFYDVLGDVMAYGHTHYWLHGGRRSTKSSFISVCIVLLLLAHPEANAMVVRRFSNTLRGFVFSQMTWAIAALGLDAWFRAHLANRGRLPADRTAHRVQRSRRPLEAQGREVRAGLRGGGVVRGARPARRHRCGAEHLELASSRRRRLLDLLLVQPSPDALELGEPREA